MKENHGVCKSCGDTAETYTRYGSFCKECYDAYIEKNRINPED